MMAENKDTFPLNLSDAFRAKAGPWLQAQLGRGNEDYMLVRTTLRGILVTLDAQAAEMYAVDKVTEYGWGARLVVTFREGMAGDWVHQVEIKGRGDRGPVFEWFSSDHLCRIVTRLVEQIPNVELVGWPEGWPKPAFKRQRAA